MKHCCSLGEVSKRVVVTPDVDYLQAVPSPGITPWDGVRYSRVDFRIHSSPSFSNEGSILNYASLRLCILRRRGKADLMDDKSEKGKEKDVSSSAPPQPHPRKGGLRFKPKVAPKKASKSVPKMEPEKEREFETVDKDLLMKLRTPQSTGALVRRSKADKNEAHVEVSFGHVNPSIARSFPTPKSYSSVKQEEVELFSRYMMSDVTTSAEKLPKQSAGPQDFTHPDYNYPPITLPLRRPSSEDTGFDEDDFGEFSSSGTQDGELTAAKELGLMVCISCCMISCRGTPFLFRYSYQCPKKNASHVDGSVTRFLLLFYQI
uniref:Uncharacterized protein n=1 Tax=Avena sativa TaxID=4498 RepID=A0ACD5X9Q8_AVESA